MNISYKDSLLRKLQLELNPSFIEIRDDSEKHKGHSGYKQTGNTHFHLDIVSKIFKGKSKIECHKLIYTILKEELQTQIHALSINARSEDE